MKFGFLIFPGAEELDFAGPWEIIGMWNRYLNGPECLTIGQTGEIVLCAGGLKVLPDFRFEDCPQLDYLLVPGGRGTEREVGNPKLISFIKQQAAVCRLVLSVCTGVFLLQAAGFLQGKRATTHWRQLERLRQCSEVTVVEARLVHDGTIWTAAGVTAGIDLALALIADQTDEETAGRVQLGAEYYPSQARYGKAHLEPQVPTYLKGHLPKKPTTLYESR